MPHTAPETVFELRHGPTPDGLATRTTLLAHGVAVSYVDHEDWDDDQHTGVLIHQIETTPGHRGHGYAMRLLTHLHDHTTGDLYAERFTPPGEGLREHYEETTGRRYLLLDQ